VELLLDGKVYDRAIADQSGQFIMVPPRLPPGDHELTLRSEQRDGKQVTSIQGVLVDLHSRPSDAPLTYKMSKPAFRVTKPQQSVSVTVHRSPSDASPTAHSRPTMQIAKRRGLAASRKQQATAPAPLSDERPPSALAAPDTATAVVSGGDSLWRISRLNYGKGERYPVIYDANRGQIQNPNRIFPGQLIVIPDKAPEAAQQPEGASRR
jgi:nucleoid-associated protein YgaU